MIIVTGPTGAIGSELAVLFNRDNILHRAIARSRDKAVSCGWKSENIITADLKNVEALKVAFRGGRSLFLLSPLSDENLNLQKNAIQAAIAVGIEKIVKVGTLITERDTRINLAKWHREAELMIEKAPLKWTFLRPTMFNSIFFEPWSTLLQENKICLPMRNGRIPLVDPADIAMIAKNVLLSTSHNGIVYNITGPESLSMSQAAIIASDVFKKTVSYINLSKDDASELLKKSALPNWLIQDLLQLFEFYANNRGSVVELPNTKLLAKPHTLRDYLQRIKGEAKKDTPQNTTQKIA